MVSAASLSVDLSYVSGLLLPINAREKYRWVMFAADRGEEK
jgi:hypothetical protein